MQAPHPQLNMDMNFWQQFCTSPLEGDVSSPDLSDLDSNSGWSPLSSLEDQENYALPLGGGYPTTTQYHHQNHQQQHSDASSTTSSSSQYSQFSPLPHHQHHLPGGITAPGTTPFRSCSSTSSSGSRPKNPVKRVQQRTAANHRERKRMKTINEAFEGLRERVPLASGDRKLSKVDTLRLAIRYIHQLSEMVTTCGKVDGQLGGQPEQDTAKVIIRCHGADFQDYCGDANGNYPLYGHSLSWTDNKPNKVGPNGRLVAKLWVPESADPTTLQENFNCESMSL